MKKMKNVRPGVLIIADARLRLEPGEVLEVEYLTTHMEQALSAGHLTRIDKEETKASQPSEKPEHPPEEPGESDLSTVTATEAISRIGAESDTDLLKAHLANEKRRTVIDALKKRLAEVDGGTE
jgi:hypothetical protein